MVRKKATGRHAAEAERLKPAKTGSSYQSAVVSVSVSSLLRVIREEKLDRQGEGGRDWGNRRWRLGKREVERIKTTERERERNTDGDREAGPD